MHQISANFSSRIKSQNTRENSVFPSPKFHLNRITTLLNCVSTVLQELGSSHQQFVFKSLASEVDIVALKTEAKYLVYCIRK